MACLEMDREQRRGFPPVRCRKNAVRLHGENNGERSVGAVSHKLLRILIGLLRHHHDFDPNWPSLHHA
jgi:hypothetical protein